MLHIQKKTCAESNASERDFHSIPVLLLLRRDGFSAIDNDLFVDAHVGLSIFEALPRGDSGQVGIDLEEAQATDIFVVPSVAAKADAAAVAHPQGRGHLLRDALFLGDGGILAVVLGGVIFPLEGEGAVIVAVVVACADHDDALLDESVAETRIE